jgi:hypothetical protein
VQSVLLLHLHLQSRHKTQPLQSQERLARSLRSPYSHMYPSPSALARQAARQSLVAQLDRLEQQATAALHLSVLAAVVEGLAR